MRYNGRAFSEVQLLTSLVAADNDISGFIKDTEGWRVIGASGVQVNLTGSIVETVMATVNIPANAMGPNGMLRVSTLWSHTNNANNKTPIVRFSGAAGTQYLANAVASTAATRDMRQIANRGVTNSQIGMQPGAISASGAAGGWGTVGANTVTTSSVDTTAATSLVIAGQLAVGTDTLTLEHYVVELKYGA